MDPQMMTAATALFLTIAVIFGGAVALLVAPVVATFARRLTGIARPDSAAADRRDS